jgi:hypothetical protein
MNITTLIFISLLIIFLIIMFTLYMIDSFSSNKWFCNVMGWHKAPETKGFDGCSFNGRCPRCGKRVLMDSQGNWFEASNQEG